MKKTFSILLAICCLLTACMSGCAAETPAAGEEFTLVLQIDNPIMTVNGTEKEIDPGRGTVPVIDHDRTLAPVRAIIEEMGGTVAWDEETQTATLTYEDGTIRLTLDSATAYWQDTAYALDAAPVSINDRTMMPIRFIAECFGFAVDWNAEQQTITITKSAQAGDPSPVPTASPTPTETPDASSSALVVYFSATGNTEALAEKIAQAAGADLYEIVPEVPYTSEDLNYNNDGCRANQELNSDARPAIQPLPVDAAQYDTIILGYPIWWGQCPPPVRTFLESYDFSGKTIMPFCTSGSSGISGSLSKIRELCPDSTITEGFRGTASTTEEQIDTWLDENGFTAAEPATGTDAAETARMRLITGRGDIVIRLRDNDAAQRLADMLPLELEFSDFNNTEKIAYPPEEIDVSNTEAGTAPKAGDLTIYAPWGNLALFYQDGSYSSSLVPLGSVEEGAEYMTDLGGTIRAELE